MILDILGSCVDDTCTVGNHTVCIRGAVNVNGSCLRKWSSRI